MIYISSPSCFLSKSDRKSPSFGKKIQKTKRSCRKVHYLLLTVLALSTTAFSTTAKAMLPTEDNNNKTTTPPIRPQGNLETLNEENSLSSLQSIESSLTEEQKDLKSLTPESNPESASIHRIVEKILTSDLDDSDEESEMGNTKPTKILPYDSDEDSVGELSAAALLAEMSPQDDLILLPSYNREHLLDAMRHYFPNVKNPGNFSDDELRHFLELTLRRITSESEAEAPSEIQKWDPIIYASLLEELADGETIESLRAKVALMEKALNDAEVAAAAPTIPNILIPETHMTHLETLWASPQFDMSHFAAWCLENHHAIEDYFFSNPAITPEFYVEDLLVTYFQNIISQEYLDHDPQMHGSWDHYIATQLILLLDTDQLFNENNTFSLSYNFFGVDINLTFPLDPPIEIIRAKLYANLAQRLDEEDSEEDFDPAPAA